MPSAKSLLPLWRPLTAPIPRQANHQFLRFSTATRLRVPKTPSSTPQETPEAPSPSRAADLAATEAATDADSAQSPAPKPTLPSQHDTSTISQTILQESKLTKSTTQYTPTPKPAPKYLVTRSKSNNLPVYTDYKRGGNLHLTTIRKITGDLKALKEEITVYLNKKKEDVSINNLTQAVIIKGHHKSEVTEFLTSKGM